MTKIFCDKCGAQVEKEFPAFRFNRPLFKVLRVDAREHPRDHYLEVDEEHVVLCPECQAKLYEFIFGKTYEQADRERWERENKEPAAAQFV